MKFQALTVNIDELIDLYEGLLPAAEEELRQLQVTSRGVIPDAPEGLEDIIEYNENGDPAEPEDITALQPAELGQLFTFFTAWVNYLQTELTNADCRRLVLRRAVDIVEAGLHDLYRSAESNVPAGQIKNKVTVDKRYIDTDRELLLAEVLYRQLETAMGRCKRVITLVSREITRRTKNDERETMNLDGRVGSPRNAGEPTTPRFQRRPPRNKGS